MAYRETVALPEIIGGKYRPRRVLGAGATGTVYSVEHAFTGEVLALKVMKADLGGSPQAVARFKREALAVSRIRSTHVVRVFDADVAPELGGVPYLVMDLLEGVDLEQLSDDKPADPEAVVEWLRQVAVALDKAHRIGIVHRDLKPENLFLTRREDGSPLVKVLDFGIAKVTSDATGTTQCGQLFGTPLYMSPEQARGDPSQVGPASDLCAIGLIAFKLLSGVPYRRGADLDAILKEILHEPLVPPSERGCAFGPEFDGWFLRSCDPNPAARFGSADEQVEALSQALGVPLDASGKPAPSSKKPRHSSLAETRSAFPVNGALSAGAIAASGAQATLGAAQTRSGGLPIAPVSPSVAPDGAARMRGNDPWRLAFFGVVAFVVLPLVALASRRLAGESPMAGSPRTACSTDVAPASAAPLSRLVSPAESVAVAAPPAGETARPDSARGGEPPKANLPPSTTPAASSSAQRDPVRTVPMRASVRPTPARNRGLVDNDPLGDQQ